VQLKWYWEWQWYHWRDSDWCLKSVIRSLTSIKPELGSKSEDSALLDQGPEDGQQPWNWHCSYTSYEWLVPCEKWTAQTCVPAADQRIW
jgi:hypothetical protein